MKVNLFFLFTLFNLIFFNAHVYSAEKTKVVYAGFAINAKQEDQDTVAKYTRAILDERLDGNIIDDTLYDITTNITAKHLDIIYKPGASSEETSKIFMVVVLDQEFYDRLELSKEVCKFANINNDCYYYNIMNKYQLLFYDFKTIDEVTFLFSVPFESFYALPIAKQPGGKETIQAFREYYKGGKWLKCNNMEVLQNVTDIMKPDNPNFNLNSSCKRTYENVLSEIKIREFYDLYLGINPSQEGFGINASKTFSLLPDYMKKKPELLKKLIANYILGEIALEHKVAIVPYYECDDNCKEERKTGLHNKLSIKFTYRNELQDIALPEPTHYIDLYLRGLVKKEYKKDANVKDLTWWIYGAGLNIRVYSDVREFLNIKTTKANYVKIPDFIKLSKKQDLTNIIELAIMPLSVEFAKKINSDFKNKEDRKWLEKITKKTGTPEEFKLLRDLFIEIATSD